MSSPSLLVLPPVTELAVVLVEPRIGQNAGNIARLCACAGIELFLVGSLGFELGGAEFRRAAMDYRELAPLTHLHSFEALLAKKPGWQAVYLSTKATQSVYEVSFAPKTLLVFGSESHGLPEAWLAEHEAESFRIPMVQAARSLNLATSVGIVVYQALRCLAD